MSGSERVGQMPLTKVQSRGQVTLPKAIRDRAQIKPGDIVGFKVIRPSKIEIKALPINSLEYFWERFQVDEPYDEDRIREEGQAEAAEEVMKHMVDN